MKRNPTQIRLELESLRERMLLKEMSDNFYYTSGRRDEDLERKYQLEEELKHANVSI